MGYLNKYGTLFGQLVAGTGRVWFVAPAVANSASTVNNYVDGRAVGSGNDSNDGLSPERPLATIDQAVINALAAAGSGYSQDIVALFPGTHFNYTAGTISTAKTVKLNCPGISFVGLQPNFRDPQNFRNYAPTTNVNMSGSGALTAWALSVAGCSFTGINFVPITAQTAMTGLTCPSTSFLDCTVTLSAAASTSTKGLVFSGGSSAYCSFINTVGLNTVATSAQGPWLDITGLSRMYMDSCKTILTGTSSAWAVAVQCGAGTSGVLTRNHMTTLDAGTITIGIDGTGVAVNNSLFCQDNYYGVSPGAGAMKNFTNGYVALAQNWYATVGGGAGFVIQTVVV